MMAAVGGGSNLEEGGRAGQEAPHSVMGQLKSHDSTFEIELLGEAMPLEDTSKVEVLREVVPSEDISGFVLLTEESVLRVARVGAVGAAAGSSELTSLSLMTALETQGRALGSTCF